MILYLKVAENQYGNAQAHLAYLYYTDQLVHQSYEKAIYWLNKAIKQENVFRKVCLTFVIFMDHSVKQNYDLAATLLQKVAAKNLSSAQTFRASMYKTDSGLPQNYSKALFCMVALQ